MTEYKVEIICVETGLLKSLGKRKEIMREKIQNALDIYSRDGYKMVNATSNWDGGGGFWVNLFFEKNF